MTISPGGNVRPGSGASAEEILIAGAGIAGLSAALALSLDGHPVTVLERESTLEAQGAGIQLGPNATRLLQRWGVGDLLRPHAATPTGVAVHNGRTGERLTRLPLGRHIERRHHAPYWIVHRGDLQQALLARLQDFPTARIRLGFRYELYKRENDHISILPHRGAALHGRALLGADGVHSQVRRQVTGAQPDPEFSGKTAWRALIDTDQLPDRLWRSYVRLWMGPRAHLVHYPVRGGRQLNIVAIVDDNWHEPTWGAPGRREDLLARFSHWAETPQRLLRLPESWRKWPLFRAPHAAGWPLSAGPVLLIGDAAHPILPFLAQGAAMAIEDGAAFAHFLRLCGGDIRTAIDMFKLVRLPRIRRVARHSQNLGHLYHLPAPFSLARDQIMQRCARPRFSRSFDWLYGYDVARETIPRRAVHRR